MGPKFTVSSRIEYSVKTTYGALD